MTSVETLLPEVVDQSEVDTVLDIDVEERRNTMPVADSKQTIAPIADTVATDAHRVLQPTTEYTDLNGNPALHPFETNLAKIADFKISSLEQRPDAGGNFIADAYIAVSDLQKSGHPRAEEFEARYQKARDRAFEYDAKGA